MQEFKVGDKVLVEMKISEVDDTQLPYKVKRDGICFLVDKVYPISKTYEDGLAEAWEAAKKLFLYPNEGGFNATELEEIFGRTEHLWELTPQESITKIKAWEDAHEIHVGDIVEMMGGLKGLVTKIKYGCYYIIYPDGGCRRTVEGEKVKKTGRSIDIAWLLAQIGGGTEDA